MNKRYLLTAFMMLTAASSTLYAQDLRERNYYFENLTPGHEYKPQVQGYATERIGEPLDRGLVAAPSADGKGIHLSWRLLASDPAETSFHVYRSANGKQRRLTKKAIKNVCDFTDQSPVSGEAHY